MTADSEPDAGDELDEGEAWRRLEAHLAWSEPGTLSFVFCADPDVVDRLRLRAERAAADDRTGRFRGIRPREPQDLREVVRELLSGRKVSLVWLEAPRSEPEWLDAWDDVLQRLNERRERLRRSLGGAMVAVAHPSVKPILRDRAPDLWSIRSVALDVRPAPRPLVEAPSDPGTGAADRRAERSNAYRMAEAVLRFQYHSRMRADPWFALVVGDDPAPRRRLLDALVARGITAMVHSRASRALSEPTELDLHWVLVDDEPDLALLSALSATAWSPSRPVIVEGNRGVEQVLARLVPELYASVAFVVRLHVERTLHPGPLPVLDRAEEAVRDVWDALDRVRSLDNDLPSLSGRDESRARSERVRELTHAAESLLAQGWVGEATPIADEVLRSARGLRSHDPDAAQLAADAEELCGKIASQRGERAEAIAHYEAALPIRRRRANSRGDQRLRRRAELARCLSVLGEIALDAGRIEDAEPPLREALAIRRRLARATDDRSTLSELAVAWSMVGDLELARHEAGDARLKTAAGAYREALRLREHLAGEEDSPRFRRLLSVSHGRVARVLAKTGDWAGARKHAERASELALALSGADPGNVAWRMEASVASSRLGDALRALGDFGAAAEAYSEAVDIRRRLVAEDPDNARWQELLAVALGRMVEVRMAQGNAEAAFPHSVRAVELSEQLTWADPGHLGWRRGAAAAWIRHGDVTRLLGRPAAAKAAFRSALAAAKMLADAPSAEGGRRATEIVQALEARGVPDGELTVIRGDGSGLGGPRRR